MQEQKDSQSDHLSQESFHEFFSINFSPTDESITDSDIFHGIENYAMKPDDDTITNFSGSGHENLTLSLQPYNGLHCSSYNVQAQSHASSSVFIQTYDATVSLASLERPEKRALRQMPPISSNYSGLYDFDIFINSSEGKTMNWTYSKSRDKLYIKMGKPCPISFLSCENVPAETKIRLLPVFTDITQSCDVVHRCYTHAIEDSAKGILFPDHLIHCTGDFVSYEEDHTGRRSVVVPYSVPPAGQSFSTYLFKFLCFGSCAGGLNRRPIKIIFTLENNDEVIGRRSMEVKICSSPLRDCLNDDKQDLKAQAQKTNKKKRKHAPHNSEDSKSEKLPKKPKTSATGEGKTYEIVVNSKAEYEFLKHCQLFFRLQKAFKELSPEMMNYLKNFAILKQEKK